MVDDDDSDSSTSLPDPDEIENLTSHLEEMAAMVSTATSANFTNSTQEVHGGNTDMSGPLAAEVSTATGANATNSTQEVNGGNADMSVPFAADVSMATSANATNSAQEINDGNAVRSGEDTSSDSGSDNNVDIQHQIVKETECATSCKCELR